MALPQYAMKTRIPLWVFVFLFLSAVLGVALAIAGEWMVRSFGTFDLSIPLELTSDYSPGSISIDGWKEFRSPVASIRLPAHISRRQLVSVEPEALIVTSPRQSLWISVLALGPSSKMKLFWYESCLRARRNPFLLMGKAMIVPPLGHPRPQLWKKQVGRWTGFFYGTPRRVVADIFDDSCYLRIVCVSREKLLSEEPWIYEAVASVRCRASGHRH